MRALPTEEKEGVTVQLLASAPTSSFANPDFSATRANLGARGVHEWEYNVSGLANND